MSTMDPPSSEKELLGRIVFTSAYTIGAVLVGTLAMTMIWVVSDLAGLGPWGGVAFLAIVAVLGVVLLRRRPGEPRPKDGPIDIPPPPDRSGDEDNGKGPLWESLSEDSPRALKMRFNDAVDNDRLDEAERILGRIRALGGEETWCGNAATTLANKRRRS